ncbi:hypothetical protein CG51_08470 [Haematobacter missouriensis]|uniref:Uncharacterized protein n=1 Tax=Haematobacter missouriensis TaxID=366616 RepID=A0A212APP2_9RHOB|nr:hypothetical protein [Haematobacter missouriensis]KFI27824.1 hypothetical protein CG51_08470 [Haematobacter missouriensis]OWJ75998.1 hypothetical protein CDV53_08780 [Haematobacter missouriensis]OWJ83429.1 hypothetical protein CDV52_11345 [Haematobacter missouriensis]
MSDGLPGRLAVLTGDIVASSALSTDDLDDLFRALGGAADSLAGLQDVVPRLTRFRGDGWQMVTVPRLAFRAALVARAAVRAVAKGRDTRLALAIGAVDRLDAHGLEDAAGAAFLASGRLLDRLPAKRRMAAEGHLAMSLALSDGIVAGWTARQAEIALHLLSHPGRTRAAVADALGIAPQIVQRQADAARLWAIEAALAVYENE